MSEFVSEDIIDGITADSPENESRVEEMSDNHRREMGRMAIYAASMEQNPEAAPDVEAMLDSYAENIAENRDSFYVVGQKMWLSSDSFRHQTDPLYQVVDGFFEQKLSTDDKLSEYARNKPDSYKQLQRVVFSRTQDRLRDSEFTPEQQHALKFRALKEFVAEDGKFGRFFRDGVIMSASLPALAAYSRESSETDKLLDKRGLSRNDLGELNHFYVPHRQIMDQYHKEREAERVLSDSVVRVSGSDILMAEDYIENDQELEEYYQHEQECRRKKQVLNEFSRPLSEGFMKRSGGSHVDFYDPRALVERLRISDEELDGFREESYFGLFEIFLSEGRTWDGSIRAADRERAANQFFETFNYSEHIDELDGWLEAKIEELHDDGNDNTARLLKRRFEHWTNNPKVSESFQKYRADVLARRQQAETEARADTLRVYRNITVDDTKQMIRRSIEERQKRLGDRFDESDGNGRLRVGDGDPTRRKAYMPASVAYERINALDQWGTFLKENLYEADFDEAAMVFDPKYNTLDEAIKHLDGNTYSVIAFNYAGRRCMIAECIGVGSSGSSAGAMKIWMGELSDRNGWERAFDKTKSEAADHGACHSINHYNLTADVMGRESDDDNFIVESEDVMFKLALKYFETDGTDKTVLRNTAAVRKNLADMIGPQMWRPNAES